METPQTQRLTGTALAALLNVTPSAISRAVHDETSVRDAAPVFDWALIDDDTGRVLGFDVPNEDMEALRALMAKGIFDGPAGAVQRNVRPSPAAVSAPEVQVAPLPAHPSVHPVAHVDPACYATPGHIEHAAAQPPAHYPWGYAQPPAHVEHAGYAMPSTSPYPPVSFAPPPPVTIHRSDKDVDRALEMHQQMIAARDAENERLRADLTRAEDSARKERADFYKQMDEAREEKAKMRDAHAVAVQELREQNGTLQLQLRAYDAGQEPYDELGEDETATPSPWLSIAETMLPKLAPAALTIFNGIAERMATPAAPRANPAPMIPPPSYPVAFPVPVAAAAPVVPPAPAPVTTDEDNAPPMPATDGHTAHEVAQMMLAAAVQKGGADFGGYLDQLTNALTLEDWKAVTAPLLAELASRDPDVLGRYIAPALFERWGDWFGEDAESVVQSATTFGFLRTDAERATLLALVQGVQRINTSADH